eukprot:3746962-Alexandrium_andersonii.AAC.1
MPLAVPTGKIVGSVRGLLVARDTQICNHHGVGVEESFRQAALQTRDFVAGSSSMPPGRPDGFAIH